MLDIWYYLGYYVVYVFGMSQFMTIYIKEKTSRVKQLQFNYGFNKSVYWISSYLIDITLYVLFDFVCIFLIIFLDFTQFQWSEYLSEIILDAILFPAHSFAVMSLLTICFNKSHYFKIFALFLGFAGM